MTTPTRILSHIKTALGGTAFNQILAGIAQLLIIRALGVSGYGAYAYLYAILAIVAAVMGAGLDTWLLDGASRHPQHLRAAFRLIVRIKIGMWLLACGVLWSMSLTIASELLWLGAIVIVGDSIANTCWQSLRGLGRHRDVALLQPVASGIVLVGVAFGYHHQLSTLLSVQAGAAVVLASIGAGRVWQVAPPTTVTYTWHDIRHSWPFVASDILAQIYTHSTTIILGVWLSQSDVGVFRGAVSLVTYSFIVPAVIFNTTLPSLNQADTLPAHKRHILGQSGAVMLIYGVVTGVIILAGGAWGIITAYGADYQASAALIGSFFALPLIKAASFWGVSLLIHHQRLMRRLVVQGIVVVWLWASAPWLIAQQGVSGAVLAQMSCEVVLAVGYVLAGVFSVRFMPVPSHPPQHIFISNTHGVANVGDVAIHRQQLRWLARAFPTATCTLSYRPTSAWQTHFPQQHAVMGLHHWVYTADGQIADWRTRLRRTIATPCALLAMRWGLRPRWGLTAAERDALQCIADSDLICASGGGYLYDTPTTRPFRRWLSWDVWLCADMVAAVVLHKPLMLLPQSFGPVHSPFFRITLRWLLRRATRVYARESPSSHWLTQQGIAHQCLPDMAWLQHGALPVMTPHTLGVTAIDWAGQSEGDRMIQQRYEAHLLAVCRHYQQRGWDVHFFVQCRENHTAWDDGVVAERLAQQCPGSHVVAYEADPEMLQQRYGRMQVLLTTRLHAAILRLAQQQPAVVVAYLPKSTGVFADLGLQAWCLDYQALHADALIVAIDSASQQHAVLADTPQRYRQQLTQAAYTLQLDAHRTDVGEFVGP